MLKLLLAALLASLAASAFGAPPVAASPLAAGVDVNRADQAGLETVKGIGPALSQRLLDERSKAPFRDWNDLIRRVKGVGPDSAARLSAGGLTVGGAAYPAAASAPRPAGSAASAASAPRLIAKP